MYITHDIEIDLVHPGTTPRVYVKQGDVMSRNVRITLYENGQPWLIPENATAVIRYHAYDPEGLTDATGIFDLLEDGSLSYVFSGNSFEVMPTAAMLAKAGVVTVDVVLLYEGRSLAMFDFEFYVNHGPVDGTEPQMQSYYRISTLDSINEEFDKLRAAIEAMGGGEYLK